MGPRDASTSKSPTTVPGWSVQIPKIDAVTKVRRREDAELMAREHIAVITYAPIAEVGVRVVSESQDGHVTGA